MGGPTQDYPFVSFDKTLDSNRLTQVNQPATHNFYGPFDLEYLTGIAVDFIAQRTDGDIQELNSALDAFLTQARDDCMTTSNFYDLASATDSCWLSIRLRKACDDYVQPRWHRDGRMFDCICTEPEGWPHCKYAVALLGPSTRVLVSTSYTDGLDCRVSTRDVLAERLRGQPEFSIEEGQIIRLTWGQDDSPIHSEPDFSHTDRVFVSLLFGSEREVKQMCDIRREFYRDI